MPSARGTGVFVGVCFPARGKGSPRKIFQYSRSLFALRKNEATFLKKSLPAEMRAFSHDGVASVCTPQMRRCGALSVLSGRL